MSSNFNFEEYIASERMIGTEITSVHDQLLFIGLVKRPNKIGLRFKKVLVELTAYYPGFRNVVYDKIEE